jgi:hypothetical protein
LLEDLLPWGQERERAAVFAVRGLGALRSQQARIAAPEREVHPRDRGAGRFAPAGPAHAGRTPRACDCPGPPAGGESTLIEMSWAVPFVVSAQADRPEQVDPVPVAGGGDDVAAIHHVLAGQ